MIAVSHPPKRVISFQTHHLLDPDPVSATNGGSAPFGRHTQRRCSRPSVTGRGQIVPLPKTPVGSRQPRAQEIEACLQGDPTLRAGQPLDAVCDLRQHWPRRSPPTPCPGQAVRALTTNTGGSEAHFSTAPRCSWIPPMGDSMRCFSLRSGSAPILTPEAQRK